MLFRSIEESKTSDTAVNVVEGMQFDKGYISPYMVTDTEKMEAILDNPYILFDDASRQIDLKVISNNKKIEVRSSFPRNGIEFAICHPSYEFDVIGPYSNNYKPGEIQKDYYVRTLFHLLILR